MDLFASILPIAVLIYLMTRKRSISSHIALPAVAVLMYAVKLLYFQSGSRDVHAAVIDGLLTAWTPIFIVFGAIFLFRTMERTGALDTVRTWLLGVTANRVAQLMIVGWAFTFLIEGASGFGTPAALAAPILLALGFDPIRAAVLCLVMNSVPVSFGAVGTPTWFGLGHLGLSSAEILTIGFKSALIHGIAAMVIPLVALRFVVGWGEIRRNIGFVYLSILSCTVPYILLARLNYEFPAIVGGMIGLPISIRLATMGVGLEKDGTAHRLEKKLPLRELAKALFPLWGTVLILLVTRIKQLGIKEWLTAVTPAWQLKLGMLGDLSISPSLVIRLRNILETETSWTHPLLYVPSIVPFIVIALITFLLFKTGWPAVRQSWASTSQQVKRPLIALLGALVFVRLLIMGDESSCAVIIGSSLAELAGESWPYFASYLGALGSFFSGSNTISNLTFGGIQDSIALNTGLNRTTTLALQSVGGAMGNMVCIHNIVAVCSILGIVNREGAILKMTAVPLVIYGVIAGTSAALLF